MPLTTEEKKAQVEELRASFDKAIATVFLDYRGVDVETITELRTKFRAAGIEYRVVKNNLIRKALEGTELAENEQLGAMLKGMTGVAWSYEDPSTAAKITSCSGAWCVKYSATAMSAAVPDALSSAPLYISPSLMPR